MCYSAQVRHAYKLFVRMFGATMSIKEFNDLFFRRLEEPESKLKIPKAMELAFLHPETEGEREVAGSIAAFHSREATRLEQELFALRKRLADAERKLEVKVTKGATDDQRIATNKISSAMRALADLKRTTLEPRDERVFPGVYAPVMVMEAGELVVMPMRYQCRPEGKPAFYDTKYPGTYNARRDNLEGFWRDLYGYRHGIMMATTFFENVKRHKMDGRELREGEKEENVVLQFTPGDGSDMLVACLWSRWKAPGQPDLLSFTAITDDPPAEVLAAGHDRCIVPIKAENVTAWLNPDPKNLAAQYAILDDRERPYYEHRLAA